MLITETEYLTQDAARYLGLSVASMHYHLYIIRDLAPDRTLGKYLVFRKSTLDAFRERKRSVGRPRNTGRP